MSRRLYMLAVSVLLITSLGTGCIGNFALVSKVRKFNLEVSEDRWGRELVFVCLYIIPAYPISGFLDLIIFNAIEFWNGEKRCFSLIRTDEGVTARDEAGNVIVSGTDLALEQLEDQI